MRSLFDPSVVDDTKQRLLQLRPESEPKWGSMKVAQTLAHCTLGMEMAIGTIRAKRAPFLVRLIGTFIKPFVFRDDKPMRRNSPSSPELFPGDPTRLDFVRERSRLIDFIESFASQGAEGCSRYPHPFFGRLKPEEWASLCYKHLDHHLRQFGV